MFDSNERVAPLMTYPLVQKLEQRDALSAEEVRVLETICTSEHVFEPEQEIVREGEEVDNSWLLLEGWTFRCKRLKGGRQIVAFHVPGDFVDLHAFLLKPMDHTVVALTRARLAKAPHDRLRELSKTHPHLTRMLWLSTLIDAAITRAWLTAIGRLPASGALAHLICEMAVRLEASGEVDARSGFRFPVTQSILGEALGLSAVHVNRSIRDLKAEGAVTWSRGRVVIDNWARLVALSEFDADYLNLAPRPR